MASLVTLLMTLWHDEHGIETLEWIAMAFLIIVLLAFAVYPGTLQGGIANVITNIVGHL